MITYTGIHCTREFGAPSIRDIAVQSMRLVRFVGAGEIFWPVGMHNMLVADLLPQVLRVDGYLHDGAEVVVNDIPQPFKTDGARVEENKVEARMYDLLGLRLPNEEQRRLIKEADMKAVCAEGTLGCGPYAFPHTQINYRVDPEAIRILEKYLEHWDPMEAINPNGRWPIEYETRLRDAIRWQRQYEKERAERFNIASNPAILGAELSLPRLPAPALASTGAGRRKRVVLSNRARSATKRTTGKAR